MTNLLQGRFFKNFIEFIMMLIILEGKSYMKRKLILLLNLVIIITSISLNSVYGANEEIQSEDYQIPILMYHHLTEEEPPSNRLGEIISVDLFKKQMQFLKSKGFNTISASQLRQYLYFGAKLPKNPILITFDDGYESNYNLAFPVLEELNMKAVISIIVSSRGKKPGEFRHFTWEEAKAMLDSGLIEIGSHTYDLHNYTVQLQPNENVATYEERIFNDFLISKNSLQKNLNIEPFIFTYPYGMYNKYSQDIALELGFDIQFTVNAGIVTKDSNPLALERINVRGDDSPQQVLANIYKYMGLEIEEEPKYRVNMLDTYMKANQYNLLNKNDLHYLENNITNYEVQQLLLHRTDELMNEGIDESIQINIARLKPILERMSVLDMSSTLLTYSEALNYLRLIGKVEGISNYYEPNKLLTKIEFVDLLVKVTKIN